MPIDGSRLSAAGRTGQKQPAKAEWLQPNAGQTPSNGGLLLEESNAHKIQVAESIAAAQKVAKDVAATNIQKLQTQNPELAGPDQKFDQYGIGWWDSLKSTVANEFNQTPLGLAAGATGADTLAPSQRDPLLRTSYLESQTPNAQTFNAELAVNRALGQHPELIAKPYLLLNAAMKDMDAHDIKYMDVMDTMMKYYQTAIMNPKGLQNAAETITNRISSTPGAQELQALGTVVKDVGGILGWLGEKGGEGQRWVEKTFIEMGGGTATEKQVDGKPMLAITPGNNILGQATGAVTDMFGTGADVLKKTWEIADSNMFGIQHAIRTADHIRRAQDAKAEAEYLGTWFATAVALNFFGKGLSLALRGLESVGLRNMLEKAGVSTDVAASLLELQQLAKVANMDNAKWLRVVQASQDWLMHQPQNVRIPAFARYAQFGAKIPDEASWSTKIGGVVNKVGTPVGRVLKDAVTYNQRHWHIPLNLELSAQLLATTNGFGTGNDWDKAWSATADGKNYIDPITHRRLDVSFGRTIANATWLDENTWWYNRVSGALDFLSWFEFDPFQSVLAPLSETKQLVNEGTLARSYPGQGIRSKSDVYRIFATRSSARRFASHVVELNRKADPFFEPAAHAARIAREEKIQKAVERWRKQGLTQAQIDARLLGSTKYRPLTDEEAARGAVATEPRASSIAQLVKSYPNLLNIIRSDELASGDNFLVMLSHAKTEEEVIDIFAAAAEAQGYLNIYRAPSRSRFLSFKDYLRNQAERAVTDKAAALDAKGKFGEAAQVGLNTRRSRAFISVRPQYLEAFKKFSNKVVRVGDPESLDMLSRAWRASGMNPLTVDLLINRLAMSRDAREWSVVYTNWVKDTFNTFVDSRLQERINMAGLSTKNATQIRNIVLTQFQKAIDELGNPFGGGAANRVYSGANINKIVDPKAPYPNVNGMEATAGITSQNEHYLAIPDYTSVDKIIGDMEKFLRSGQGQKAIFQRIEEMVAGPYDAKLAEIQKQQDDIVANLAKTANTAPMKMPAEESDWFRPILDEIKTDGYTGTPITEETFGGGYGPLAEDLYQLHRAISMRDTSKLKELIYDYDNQSQREAFSNFQNWYNNGDIIVLPGSVPMVIRNNKGQIVAWGDIEVYADDEQAINLGGAFDADAIPSLIQELAKQAVLSTDESFRIRNFALSESETAFQFLHKKYPKLADYLNIPTGNGFSAGTSIKTIQRLAMSGAKDPFLNAEILPRIDTYRIASLSEKAYVDRVFAQNEEFFKPTVTETALGKTFTPQQRFATASTNDNKRVQLTDWHERERASELRLDYQHSIFELKNFKPEIKKTLKSLFPEYTDDEIAAAFSNGIIALDPIEISKKLFESHDFILELVKFFRHADNKPSYELIHNALPEEVIDILDAANQYAREFYKFQGIPEAIKKYATSSQRERAWLRSFTLDQEYNGFRHSLGEIEPKELKQFKEFVAFMDTGMEQLDQEIRVVRVLNPDEVSEGKTYSPGMGDFPGSIRVGKKYVTPLPFTLDKSTGFVRPMTLEEVVPGAILHDPSFQSTSFGKYFGSYVEDSLTHPFARPLEDAIMDSTEITHTVLNLTVPPEIKAIDAISLSPNNERELILQRGLTSVITHVEVVKSSEFDDRGVLQIYAAVLPQGAQENPMVVYMRNRERLDALAMDRLTTSGQSWVDMESKINELDRRVAANKARREIEPQDKPVKGFQQDVMDRLRREISMRGETAGLNYEQVKQLQSFADMIGEDMFEGVRLRTISRAKGADSTVVGSYEFANKLINLYSRAVFDEKGINRTLIHELWHHLSTFLPKKEVAVFSKNLEKARQRFLDANDMVYWRRTIDDEYIKNLEELAKHQSPLDNTGARHELKGIKYIDSLIKRGWHKDTDKIVWDSLPDAYAGGIENYRLASIDEYFAETMYDRTMSKLSSTNPIVEFAYNIISKIIQGIGKFSDAFASRRVFDNFINQRYAAENGVDLNLALRSIPKNRYQREANMALNPQHSDPEWQALEQKRIDLEDQRKQALEDVMGDKQLYSLPERVVAGSGDALRYAHDYVRHWFIDNFFRKLVLATGSFSMRVSASEGIANAFRLGPVEYTKAAMFAHVDTAAKAYEKAYKTVVAPEEMSAVQRMVYNILSKTTEDEIKFYANSLTREGVRLTKRMERDFFQGLLGGKGLDDYIQLMTKDMLVNGAVLGGLSADEAGVYGGGADSVEAQMRNLSNGAGTGQWTPQRNVNNRSMTDLSKILTDIANDNLSRGVAKILSDYLDPNKFVKWDFQKRLDAAMEESRQYVKHMVSRNPRDFDNMKRRQAVNESTRDKIADDIRAENGLPASAPIQGSLLDELKDRLAKINPLEEWADATVQHVLWATHGRGASGGFDFPNMGGRVFHRRVLNMLADGKAPQTAREIESLYLTPDLEHARVMQHQKATRGKGGAQATAYHDVLYDPKFKYSDESTFDPRELADKATATTPEELKSLKEQLISKHKPKPLVLSSRAKRGVRKQSRGISRRYDDMHGNVTSLFPDNIPGQDLKTDVPFFGAIDKLSNAVHDVISRKVIDSVSRRPLYYLELKRQMDFLKPFVDAKVFTEETALTIAQSRAINVGIKYVHNPQDRLVFEQWSRAYAPFWFAENQAFKRLGRMALENPAGFEKYMILQLMFMHAAARSTENIDSQNGVLMPLSIAGGKLFTTFLRQFGIGASSGVPIGLTGSITSLNSVFPWNDPTGMHTGSPMALVEHMRPEFSPVVSAPLKIFQTRYPYGFTVPGINKNINFGNIANETLGEVGANADWLQMFIPNPALRAVGQEIWAIPSFFDSSGNVSDFTRQIDSIQYGLMAQAFADQTNALKDKAAAAAKASWYSDYGSLASAYKAQYPDYYNHYLQYKTNVFLRTGYEDPQNPSLGFKSVDEYWNNRNHVTGLIRQTRSAAMAIYMGRTALSFFSPLSLQATKVNPEVSAYLRSLVQAGTDTKKLSKVLSQHPEFISFALSHQSASGLGTPLESTLAVEMFQEQNADLFSKGENLSGLYAFTPWTKELDTYSSKVYQTQSQTGVRKKLSMQDSVLNLARQTGNWFVYDYINKTDPEDEMGGRADATKYGTVNVAWSQSQGDSAKNRARAFREIESILKIPGITKREGFNKTAPVIKSIIELYRSYQDELDRAAPGNSQTLNEQWVADLERIKKQHPEATYSIETLFKNMKLRDVK